MKSPASKVCVISRPIRVHTGKFVQNFKYFKGLLKDSPMLFKDYTFMQNTGLYVKIRLPHR